MTKQEFLQRYKDEKLNIGEYILIFDKISDAPLVLGCAYDQGVWKIYETRERGGHFVIKEKNNEDEAFDYFYKVVLSEHNLQNN
ncbi:hypothetical protein [Bacillus sp. RAR_GA_16]|uniref:hypothetical protein n=1 Tax=Bacillus sp. RAR_GA_16 TaxID=2876774 RepID=UPI001CC9F31F|nr:hypothetical protein [Bacillus sp. RAR_GA_16]MCA0174660.1 hypothetical protein [Bacillus sp. RAR_GA_16]